MNQISMTVNGKARKATVEPRLLLVHYLREQLRLTGTHVACDTSQCGACTVLVDGRSGKSPPVQNAFWEEHGLQCGYCTPGMIMAAVTLLEQKPKPSEREIREGIS